MSPHADNRFSGHMAEGDPRDLMFACGGCDWPTVSAYKYLLVSTNATGVLEFLNTAGILMEPLEPLGSSWQFQYMLAEAPIIVVGAVMVRYFPVVEDKYRFDLWVSLVAGNLFSITDFPRGPCNGVHALTQGSVGFPVELGNTGSDFKALPVEWNESRPPGGWPP